MIKKTALLPVGLLLGSDPVVGRGLRPSPAGARHRPAGLSDSHVALLPEAGRRCVLEPQALRPVPVLGPLQAGAPEVGMDTPSEDEVMRALEKARPVQGGIPFLHEVQRNKVRIIVEPIADYVDPPRFYPAGRPGAAPPRPLQVHRLLQRGHPRRLADPAHHQLPRIARKWSTSTTTTCTWWATSIPDRAPAIPATRRLGVK